MNQRIELIAIPCIPLVHQDDNIGEIILRSCQNGNIAIHANDIMVIAQKIISKAEGAVINLNEIQPSTEAEELAEKTGRDPRLCQVYLNESTEILEVKGRMVITRHKLGFINSGACVDRSNVAAHDDGWAVILPKDPDESARRIRSTIFDALGVKVAVIINDSLGRNDRDGSVGMAIGLAGIRHLEFREQNDLFGNESKSRIALVDELAAAGSILMGQANEGYPIVIVKGVEFTIDESASIGNILNT